MMRARELRLRRVVAPVLDDGVGQKLGLRDFIPADWLFSMIDDDLLRALHERPVLIERQRLDFVTADVDVWTRRHRGELTYYVVDEAVGDLVLNAEGKEADLNIGVRRRPLTALIELAVGAEG
jgi:hypothetical protein